MTRHRPAVDTATPGTTIRYFFQHCTTQPTTPSRSSAFHINLHCSSSCACMNAAPLTFTANFTQRTPSWIGRQQIEYRLPTNHTPHGVRVPRRESLNTSATSLRSRGHALLARSNHQHKKMHASRKPTSRPSSRGVLFICGALLMPLMLQYATNPRQD